MTADMFERRRENRGVVVTSVVLLLVFQPKCVLAIDGTKDAAEGSSFCESCESPELIGVSTCECRAFCCTNGYIFPDGSICKHVVTDSGDFNCEDACLRCVDIGDAENKERCFQSCCRTNYFAASCKSWRYSSTDVFISGTKIVMADLELQTDRSFESFDKPVVEDPVKNIQGGAGGPAAATNASPDASASEPDHNQANNVPVPPLQLQSVSGDFDQPIPTEVQLVEAQPQGDAAVQEVQPMAAKEDQTIVDIQPDTHQYTGCAPTAECSSYCDGFSGQGLDVVSSCAVTEDGLKSDYCGGWACHHSSLSRAEDSCFCCCGSSSVQEAPDSNKDGEIVEDPCDLSKGGNGCLEFCGLLGTGYLPFSCLLSELDDGRCGGQSCDASSTEVAPNGCNCCCHQQERPAISGDQLSLNDNGADAQEMVVTGENALHEAAAALVQCDTTASCADYCGSLTSPTTPVHSMCLTVDEGGLSTCAGWGCTSSTTAPAVAPAGCGCCCSAYSEVDNSDSCAIIAGGGSCIAFCAAFQQNYMPLSCESPSNGSILTSCGGHACQEAEQGTTSGCSCCCAASW